jgi:hypothetical protein
METKKLEAYVTAANMCRGQADLAQESLRYSDLADGFERFAEAIMDYASILRYNSKALEDLINNVNPDNGFIASRIASDAKGIYDRLTEHNQPRWLYPNSLDACIQEIGETLIRIAPDDEQHCSAFIKESLDKLEGNLPPVANDIEEDELY